MKHFCHARGCNRQIPRKMLMCLGHWAMVPRAIQRRVWVHYKPGQEKGHFTPSQEWHEAADAAIQAVAIAEGLQ